MGDNTTDTVQDRTLKGLHSTASKIRIWSSSHIVLDLSTGSALNPKSYQVGAGAGKSRAVEHLQERFLEAASARNEEEILEDYTQRTPVSSP